MLQQTVAVIIIMFFIFRMFWQKKSGKISGNEFFFWLVFWFFSVLAVIFIKKIDYLVAKAGFSGSGIEILVYLGVAVLFFFVFRLGLRIEKIEKDITKIIREITLLNKNK